MPPEGSNMTAPGTEAIHEGAHVVAAHHFGHRITRADLSGCEVEVATSDGVSPAGQTAFETIVVSLAGGYAAKRFSGNGANGDGADNAYTKYLALRLAAGRANEAEALLDWLRIRAAGLVDRNWRQIQKVAAALSERGTLSGEQIEEILRDER
jgi:hypothetical protein